MKKSDYLNLVKCRFLSNYGGTVVSYWGKEEREQYHKYSDINTKMLLDLETKLDYNNLVILFPLALRYGTTCLFGENLNNRFPIDHCTYIIDIREFLHKNGIKYKDNISMIDRKYSQFSVAILVIQDGIAYVNTKTANPSDNLVDTSEYCSELKITEDDMKHLNLNNKEIIFSGVLVERIRKNKI